ncbi:LysR family transcriptional regulator [Pseudalkalibacillus caeni]|uniref:LysR family transcriptional regulator n=1 Tax=Exobacillus caeni TaxID=2574798 RepID=A0A5R9F5W2_9BACL|nr:LysR family transcriptional regulator [Pseudalkalibacillus caeni]TLS37716.1 LysR family transcriptional regulator [Pseudalkalibacillus caeni]
MNLSEFRILSVLAEECNMRRASEKLYVSQPALSQRLQNIEKAWGVQIFLRSQKGLTVTPEGERIIEFVMDTLKREEKVRDELTSLSSEVHGTLKLAVASIIGQYWLPKALKKFVDNYPYVKVSLITGWSSEILKHLYEDEIHIGIIRGNPEWKGKKEYLLSDELYLVDTTIQSIEEIQTTTKPFIQFKSDSTYYQEIQEWWQSQFLVPPSKTIVVDQIETCKQMALNGIGFAILPSISLTDSDTNFYKIPLKDQSGGTIKRDTWLLSNETASELKQVSKFIELIKEV